MLTLPPISPGKLSALEMEILSGSEAPVPHHQMCRIELHIAQQDGIDANLPRTARRLHKHDGVGINVCKAE